MRQESFGFLFAAGLILGMSSLVSAGPIAGIARTDGQPLETGPFDSQPSAAGPEIAQITQEFKPMYLTSQPNTWTKTFRWEIPANTGFAPDATMSIMESIPLIYPADPAGTDPLVKLPIADWHESIVGGDVNDFFQWDTQNPNTRISARIGSEGVPINGQVSFSSDSKTIWFDFDPIQIPSQLELGSTPVTLDIFKYLRWTGPVLDPIPTAQHIDILVSEYPSTSELAGDYNLDGVVDAADYTVWRDGLGTTYSQADYNIWKSDFGNHAGIGPGAIPTTGAPEPATLWMFLTGILTLCSRRRPKVP
jgi:hypothetical protein